MTMMNARIQELAEQAELNATLLFNKDKLEKFAQLIAQECAQLAMTQHTSPSPADYGDMEPYDQGCDDTASTISGLIRRTFGVEE